MSTSPSSGVSPVPGHLRTVTPRLVVRDGPAAIDFYGRAFGAVELGERFTGPDGELIHAEIQIGDSVVMITEDGVDGPVASPERLAGLVSCVMSPVLGGRRRGLGPGGRRGGRGDVPAGGPVLRRARRADA